MADDERPIDAAMAADRPIKRAMRDLWVNDAVEFFEENDDGEGVLYLTLSGRDGRDIAALAEAGIIKLTEIGGIAEDSKHRIVAVENDPEAVYELQSRFPGLKIYERNFEDLLKGTGFVEFPEKGEDDFDACRARVINLDFNGALECIVEDGPEIEFPALNLVKKLGQLHADRPRLEWKLYLTFNGNILWRDATSAYVAGMLRINFDRSREFRESAKNLMGRRFVEDIQAGEIPRFQDLPQGKKQNLLMMFVPKKIVELLIDQNWRIETIHNVMYGGHGTRNAPMVSWIIGFQRTQAHDKMRLYSQNVDRILQNPCRIDPDGTITQLQQQ